MTNRSLITSLFFSICLLFFCTRSQAQNYAACKPPIKDNKIAQDYCKLQATERSRNMLGTNYYDGYYKIEIDSCYEWRQEVADAILRMDRAAIAKGLSRNLSSNRLVSARDPVFECLDEALKKPQDALAAWTISKSVTAKTDSTAQAMDVQDAVEQKKAADQAAMGIIAAARSNKSLNPFGGGAGSFQTEGGLAGQACRWMKVTDPDTCSSRTCFYSDGQTISMGTKAYECRAGRWAIIRDCDQTPNANFKSQCIKDILEVYGTPESKELARPKIYSE